MWKAKEYITIVLAAILVTLLIINTVRFETTKETADSNEQKLESTINFSRHKTLSPSEQQLQQQLQTAEAGERESFNSESTGLGDLEGSDEFKKMLRRSIRDGGVALPTTRSLSNSEEPLLSRFRKHYKRQASRRASDISSNAFLTPNRDNVFSFSSNKDNSKQIVTTNQELAFVIDRLMQERHTNRVPIVELTRRADANHDRGQSEDPMFGLDGSFTDNSKYSDNGGASKPLIGEFGSRISLLTMRKDPNANLMIADLPVDVDLTEPNEQEKPLDSSLMRSLISDGAKAGSALETIHGLIRFLDKQNPTDDNNTPNAQSNLIDPMVKSISLDSNYLPRITRAFM